MNELPQRPRFSYRDIRRGSKYTGADQEIREVTKVRHVGGIAESSSISWVNAWSETSGICSARSFANWVRAGLRDTHEKTLQQATCDHVYDLSGYSGIDATFRCADCERRVTVRLDDEAQRLAEEATETMWRDIGAKHRIWHLFCRRFRPGNEWAATGYELMKAIRIWAKRHETVQLLRVDDNHATSSLLVLIPHGTDRVEDVTMVFVPQCAGAPAVIGFHLWSLEAFRTTLESIRIERHVASEEHCNADAAFRIATRRLLDAHLQKEDKNDE